jgi:2-keto-3-deoxy-L-rhamnonate aldolase RhmA
VNKIEKNMCEILRTCKNDFGVVSVKAEFEAEGTRVDELLRLVDIAKKCDLKITVKIGGCEAIRDLYESKQIGVDYVVAPMVETSYATTKFINAKNLVFQKEEQEEMEFLTNIETETSYINFADILNVTQKKESLDGFVFGRVDFVGSANLNRKEVNSELVLSKVSDVASRAKEAQKKLVVGGGVSSESITFLREVKKVHLTRYETRKVVFDASSINLPNIEVGLKHAVHFELLWLLNKKEYYGAIHQEDDKRIKMLEDRWEILKNKNEKY